MYDGRWQSEIDRVIVAMLEEAERDGILEPGKRLELGDDPYTPESLRVAYKLLKDHDVLPEWIMMNKDLEKAEQGLHEALDDAVRRYQQGLSQAARINAESARQRAEAQWQAARQDIAARVERHNQQVLTYNLKVPAAIPHRTPFNLTRQVERRLRR